MTTAIIILSVISTFLLFRLYAKREKLDYSKIWSNRIELHNLACNDWKQRKINKELFRTLSFLFHPDFRNPWDYVPSERREYTSQMYKLDSNFWKSYKLTPDFVIPANIVYELYKEYVSQHIIDNLKLTVAQE